MEKKKFSEYSIEEKKALLRHWWHYYGKEIYTFAEKEKIDSLIDENYDLIKDAAVFSFMFSTGNNTQLLHAIRHGEAVAYLNGVLETLADVGLKQKREETEEKLIDELVHTYNNPEPDVPLSVEEFMEQIKNLYTEFGYDSELTVENVEKLFEKCVLGKDEIKDGVPTEEASFGVGVNTVALFNTERLNHNKTVINKMLNQVMNIDKGVYFANFGRTFDDVIWTSDQVTMDHLVSMGLATGLLGVPKTVPSVLWESNLNGTAFFVKNNENVNSEVRGIKPESFPSVILKLQNEFVGVGQTKPGAFQKVKIDNDKK